MKHILIEGRLDTSKNKLVLSEPTNDKSLKEELKIYTDLDEFEPWSGAVDVWDAIVEADKIEDLEDFLSEMFPNGVTKTQLNDMLWFEGESILSELGIAGEEDYYDDEESEDDYSSQILGLEDDDEEESLTEQLILKEDEEIDIDNEDEIEAEEDIPEKTNNLMATSIISDLIKSQWGLIDQLNNGQISLEAVNEISDRDEILDIFAEIIKDTYTNIGLLEKVLEGPDPESTNLTDDSISPEM